MYKVLIVEDEEMIRIGIRYSIDWIKADCIVIDDASNGEDGLNKIATLKPDIVITDINMPIMDGITMIEKGAKKAIFSAIIVSGYDEFELAQKAINLGVCEYLIKPLEQEEVFKALDRAKTQVDLKKKYELIKEEADTFDIEVLPIDLYTGNHAASKHVNKMTAYIQGNYQQRISIQDLVEELGMSSTYLNQRFKAATTYTFNDFLNRYRIQMALNLMKSGEDAKIYNIASDVGFSDYKYFISVFKKYVDYTPSHFLEYYRELSNE